MRGDLTFRLASIDEFTLRIRPSDNNPKSRLTDIGLSRSIVHIYFAKIFLVYGRLNESIKA